ncbi:MAG: hypothetical protein ACLGH0_05040 [Thermoanaerobaculia bacterium]
MKSHWETHRGTRFYYADYSGYGRDIDALRAEVDFADSTIEREPPDSVLVLVDIRNTVTSTHVVSLMKDSAVRTKGIVRKLAVIGVTGVQKILASAVARFSREPLYLFDAIDEARDWLVSGEGKQPVVIGTE